MINNKRFVIIVKEIKGEKLLNPIVKIQNHEIDDINTIDYICWRLYEETVDDMNLYDSDEVEVLPENY